MARLASIQQAQLYVKSRRAAVDDSLSPEEEQVLGLLLDAFSKFLVKHTGRKFFPEPAFVGDPPADTAPPVIRTFTYPRRGDLRVPDLREITAVSLGGIAITNVEPYYPTWELTQAEGEPATHFRLLQGAVSPFVGTNRISITGRWGFASVPEDIAHVCLTMVARAYKKRDANYADIVQQGMDQAAFSYFKSLPEELRMIVGGYKVPKLAFV